MAREINLVPDIKDEMIRTLKLRNFIFFICIVVAAASIIVTAIFGSIAGGQQLAIDGKKSTINNLSTKLNSFTDLSDYLTIKDQLSDLSTIADHKTVLSRTFNILSALLPHGADTITISELSINLSESDPVFTFDAQADAGADPYIDYNVLDSFKKSMAYMRYDYGRYVDKDGTEIPAYCMVESDADGTFKDAERGYYAYWLITGNGCNPVNGYGADETYEDEEGNEIVIDITDLEAISALGYTIEEYNSSPVVRIWRTPQFTDWYKAESVATKSTTDEPYMDLDGNISNVAHFASECITYSGDDSENATTPTWTETNDACLLVPEGSNGIKITDSSNGRNSSNSLVLRFSANITLAPEVYQFKNYHMLALSPTSRHNVTDSYVQIQAMFGKRAEDCAEDDTACNTNTNGGQ